MTLLSRSSDSGKKTVQQRETNMRMHSTTVVATGRSNLPQSATGRCNWFQPRRRPSYAAITDLGVILLILLNDFNA